MELEGVVHNGVIVPDDECRLPEGTRVRITPSAQLTLGDRLIELARQFEHEPDDLPADLSVNHDHYLYGGPKREP
jgi:hypothetical protein